MLIIGSHAARYSIPGWRGPGDLDIIGTGDDYYNWLATVDVVSTHDLGPLKKALLLSTGTRVEWEIWGPDGPSKDKTSAILDRTYGKPWPAMQMAPPEVLLMLKMSHRYLKDSPHFWKTMGDIYDLRAFLGCHDVPSDLQGLLKQREDETYEYAHPNLDRSKEDFFADDSINYIYDHDSLHESVAVEPYSPAYLQYLKPGAAVAVDMNVFDSLPIDVRINGVVEEASVLALERSLIPFWLESGNIAQAQRMESWAFRHALMKVCSSITSGRFREFAWEHAYRAMARFAMEYENERSLVNRFIKDREHGTIKRL